MNESKDNNNIYRMIIGIGGAVIINIISTAFLVYFRRTLEFPITLSITMFTIIVGVFMIAYAHSGKGVVK